MKTVGSLLSHIFKGIGIEDKIRLESIRREWHELFNEPLSIHTCPVELKNGELVINVDSPAWLQQLKFFQQEIKEKLKTYNISSVRLKIGSVYHKEAGKYKREEFKKTAQSRRLSDDETDWMNSVTAAISDAELKESISKVIEKSVTRVRKP